METRKKKFLLWSATLAILLACAPLTGSSIPTVDPDQINQFIAQTADAAATRTAAALSASTSTATLTPTPTNTSTPSPTETATVIFQLATFTSPVTATATFFAGGGGTSADDFACEVLSAHPPSGTSFRSRETFDAAWTVKNIGQRKWNEGVVDLVFESGTRMHARASYELQSDVPLGGTVNLVAEMEAPPGSGSYTTTWALRRGNDSFCLLYLSIYVR